MRAADAEPGRRFRFGYEEALGYAVTDLVATRTDCRRRGPGRRGRRAGHQGGLLATRLDDLARRLACSHRAVLRIAWPAVPDAGVALLEAARAKPPIRLLGEPVAIVDDLGLGLRSREDGTKDPLALPRAHVIICVVPTDAGGAAAQRHRA